VQNPFISAYRFLRALVLPTLLALSIIINLALLFSTSVYGAAQSVVDAMTRGRSVATQQADEIVRLSSDLDAEKAVNRQVRSELAEAQGELARERAAKRRVRTELAAASAELAAAKALQRQARNKVVSTASRVTNRAAKTAAREVASMPGEALPVLGTAVIIGATALELADLCQTIQDMTALQQALDPEITAPDEQLTVCAIEVPSRKKLTAMAYNAPEKAWTEAKEFVPELMNADIPDVDWKSSKEWISSVYVSLVEKAMSTGGWIEHWLND